MISGTEQMIIHTVVMIWWCEYWSVNNKIQNNQQQYKKNVIVKKDWDKQTKMLNVWEEKNLTCYFFSFLKSIQQKLTL